MRYAHDPGREGVGPPRRPLRPRRARPALHRPAPRARGDLAAGVRRASPERPHGAPPRPHRRHRGPQRPDRAHRSADRRPDLAHADRGVATQLRRVRHPPFRDGRARAGHRARDRPRAGPHAAGHDRGVRRQPHLDPRRVRCARLRHRHERGRARARDADAPPDAARTGWRSPSTASCPRARPPRT